MDTNEWLSLDSKTVRFYYMYTLFNFTFLDRHFEINIKLIRDNLYYRFHNPVEDYETLSSFFDTLILPHKQSDYNVLVSTPTPVSPTFLYCSYLEFRLVYKVL